MRCLFVLVAVLLVLGCGIAEEEEISNGADEITKKAIEEDKPGRSPISTPDGRYPKIKEKPGLDTGHSPESYLPLNVGDVWRYSSKDDSLRYKLEVIRENTLAYVDCVLDYEFIDKERRYSFDGPRITEHWDATSVVFLDVSAPLNYQYDPKADNLILRRDVEVGGYSGCIEALVFGYKYVFAPDVGIIQFETVGKELVTLIE